MKTPKRPMVPPKAPAMGPVATSGTMMPPLAVPSTPSPKPKMVKAPKIHRGHGKMPAPAAGATFAPVGHAPHAHDTYKKGKR